MQVVLSATLSRLYRVLGDFHTSTDTAVQNFLLVLFSTFRHLWNRTYGVVKGFKQSLPLQLSA